MSGWLAVQAALKRVVWLAGPAPASGWLDLHFIGPCWSWSASGWLDPCLDPYLGWLGPHYIIAAPELADLDSLACTCLGQDRAKGCQSQLHRL